MLLRMEVSHFNAYCIGNYILVCVDTRTLYATVVDAEDHLEHVDGHKFVFKEFMDHPEKFRSTFNEKVYASF